MISVITNIYNKKTKGLTLMELFTATGKLKKVIFFNNQRCSLCAPQVTRHTSIRYSSSCHTRTSAWVHRYSSLLQWSVTLGQRGLLGVSFAYFARNARCTVTTDLHCDIPTHKTTSPPERPFSHYIHSHRLTVEMWTTMKNNLLGKNFFELFLLSVQVS